MDFSRISSKSDIQNFYNEFGIKQYNSFSGGFRYLEKGKQPVIFETKQKQISKSDLYKQFGLTNVKVKTYKLNNEYVPNTKSELADKLMEKIEHQRKKMKYYRGKYYPEYAQHYEQKYKNQ